MATDKLRIMQWNCRSISTNVKYLKQYIDDVCPHVISIQSLGVNFFNLPKLNGYFYPPVTNIPDSKNGKLHTALYMRQDTQYVPIKSPVQKTCLDTYSSAIKIRLNNDTDINVVSIYYPKGPNTSNIDWINELDQSKGNWVITGDFNCHSPYWDKSCFSSSNNKFEKEIMYSNLVLLNDGRITRIPEVKGHKPSAIDLSLVSPNLADGCTWDIEDDTLGSDHLPIIINLNDYEENLDEEDMIPKFVYKKANWTGFQLSMNNIDIDFDSKDIDEIYTEITETILTAAKQNIPLIKNPRINFQIVTCGGMMNARQNARKRIGLIEIG